MNRECRCAFSSEELHEILKGYWYPENKGENSFFIADYFVTGTGLIEFPNTCFVAMTKETWLRGTGNGGHYENIFSDSHISLVKRWPDLDLSVKNKVAGIIAERPILEFENILPQLIVENSYEAIKTLSAAAREKMAENGTIIAVTGAVGKSTTVNMLFHLLHDESDYISNTNGHNSRTGVWMWSASLGRYSPFYKNLLNKPNVCTLEVAESALWMQNGGICKWIQPNIGVITHNALTQYQQGSRNIREISIAMSKICNGIKPGGKAVLYRDMPQFEFIKENVINYGAAPVIYGETPDCDTYVKKYDFTIPTAGENIAELYSDVDAVVLGEEISYKIGAIGKPVVLNSLAALTCAKLAGFDIGKIAEKLGSFKGNENVMQLYDWEGVCVLDCSHNLEIPSIIAAFDLLKKIKQKPGTKKIVLLSRIVNWGEKAPELHLELKQPINDSGFDKFFFHEPLDEFKYLIDAIPEQMSGGRHKTAESVTQAVSCYIKKGDSVLVMGAARGCDFGKVMGLLKNKITHKNNPDFLSSGPFSCTAYSLDRKKRLADSGNMSLAVEEGLGHILILHLTLTMLFEKKINLTDLVNMEEPSWRERNMPKALGVSVDEKIPLKNLLDAYIAANSPDAVIAVAHFIFRKASMRSSEYFKNICAMLSIDSKAAVNLTGRKNFRYEQFFTANDLEKIACFFFSLPLDAEKPLKSTSAIHKDKTFESDSVLHSEAGILSYYCFGENAFHAIARAKINEENIAICVCGAKTPFERDFAVCEMLFRVQNQEQNNAAKDGWIVLDSSRGHSAITIAGDTYFGERYTRARERAGETDALQKYGYSHSFEKIASLLPKTDHNIINFEAVLTKETDSPFKAFYDFILDASPDETIAELKNRNINTVMLANNHGLDFGTIAGKYSGDLFVKNGINTIGFGDNVNEAEKPLCFDCSNRQVILFNAYWYRAPRHFISRHYAIGGNAGTACIFEHFFQKIAEYRNKYPKAYIIFSPHWGTDFTEPDFTQRQLAQRAVLSGADCIIGHGSHIISDIEFICEKPVVYSVGNFVFNSNGEDFLKKNKPPFAYVAKLLINTDFVKIHLYPITAYNPDTFWQPYPVTQEQLGALLSIYPQLQEMVHKDEIGYYFEIFA